MKVLVTPRSFGSSSTAPLDLLREHGVQIVPNNTGSVMNEAQVKAAITGCEGVIIGVDPLSADAMSAAPMLRAVSKYGVGLDNIDLDYCRVRGIAVSKTVGANSASVADYAFALMLALARKVIAVDAKCRERDWSKITTSDVAGKSLGLIGLGMIGKQMVRRAKGFSMRVMAYDVEWDEQYAAGMSVEFAEIDSIMRECDFISLHLPLLPDTRAIIGAERVAMMKPTAYIINTARGGLIDEGALISALKAQKIAGAGIDAFSEEPPTDPEWYALDNVIMGSHCAASTTGANEAMGRMAAENLLRDLAIIKA
jgi:D-3-phosphoglycerate dehydrogenase